MLAQNSFTSVDRRTAVVARDITGRACHRAIASRCFSAARNSRAELGDARRGDGCERRTDWYVRRDEGYLTSATDSP